MSYDVREYLKSPPSESEVKALIDQLGLAPHDLLRKKEAEYKLAKLSADSTEQEIIAAIVAYPRLLERPILITEKGARIGRPTELLLEIL